MSSKKISLIDFWGYLISGIVIFGLLACYVRLLLMPLSTKITFLADDGFYYLVLARNFAQTGQWSFDHSISFTSGFHLLFGYLLVLLYKIFSEQLQFIQAALATELIALLACFWVVIKATLRLQTPILLLSFSLLAVASSSWSAWTSIVEWPFVILMAAIFVYCYRFSINIHLLGYLLIGFLGSLARSDFGLLPFCIFAIAAVTYQLHKNRSLIFQPAATLAGSALGAILVIVHSAISTGQSVQGSALMKTFWTEVGGISVEPILNLIGSIIPGHLAADMGIISLSVLGIFTIFGLIGLILMLKKSMPLVSNSAIWQSHDTSINIILVISSIATICAYLVFYTFNSMGIAYWYTANFFIPLTILFTLIGQPLVNKKILAMPFYLACTLLVAFQLGVFYKIPHGLYTWHNAIMQAANYIRDNYPKERIACWSSGIPGYFAGEDVFIINVDGLMNNDIYTYAKKGQFLDYLKSRKITYVADWPKQIPSVARLSGYLGSDFIKHLQPIKTFPDECPQDYFTSYTIYKITDYNSEKSTK